MKDNITHYLNITRDYTHFNYGTTLTKKDIDYYFGICEKMAEARPFYLQLES